MTATRRQLLEIPFDELNFSANGLQNAQKIPNIRDKSCECQNFSVPLQPISGLSPTMAQKESFIRDRQAVTFLDLFAGAGGISEGFLQADAAGKYYDFVLASDINDNCELTHRVRYNVQLGLDTKFLTCDIMSPHFLPQLLEQVGNKTIDVVTGGPCCQSFSLAGARKKFDKRDDLFLHYLKVIRALRPKYFVMENVKGLLTKDGGRIKDTILKEIRSIIDTQHINELYVYISRMLQSQTSDFVRSCYLAKIKMDAAINDEGEQQAFFDIIEAQFKQLTRKMEYHISKSNEDVNTIRHGLRLLGQAVEREKARAQVINLKTLADLNNDALVDAMNDFIAAIDEDTIIHKMLVACDGIQQYVEATELADFKQMIELYSDSLDEVFTALARYAQKDGSEEEYNTIMNRVRLYRIAEPFVALSSNYGVPQNRERVLFIGCRNDQTLISDIPATVHEQDKVTVYEAISDLDFIGNGETKTAYEPARKDATLAPLVQKRQVVGVPDEKAQTYAEWSKQGRLTHRFEVGEPFYVKSSEELDKWLSTPKGMQPQQPTLFNHQTSSQDTDVRERLRVIAQHGEYDEACKCELKGKNLDSNKRNYTVLNPKGQSPTVVTMPDDFIHYADYRPLTVREMARLQSFDDSFVFQGKRQTGGEKRKVEIPQYTLVGNAVPPLMARAIGNKILSVIQ